MGCNLKFYYKHPIFTFRKIVYFAIGTSIGRLLYPPRLFKSRWFDKPTTKGWEWITRGIFNQRLSGINAFAWWPITSNQNVANPNNIIFHVDDLNNFQMPGSYFQAFGKIRIGKGTYIAQNVGIITANHDFNNLDEQAMPKDITIGEKCWIGMNSVILPGVILGDNTIVGAGSIVTKSFPDGKCIIAGNPARIVRKL